MGPLWFVALLLIFSLAYCGIRFLSRDGYSLTFGSLTKGYGVLLFLSLVLVTFLIRAFSPVGNWLPILGIQPAHLPQYALCFVLGIMAYRRNSLESLNFKSSKRWFLMAQILILLVFPSIFLLTGGAEDIGLFMGGVTFQSLLYILWEQAVAVSMIIGCLGLSKHYFNRQSDLQRDLSTNSYGIYVLHGLVLVPFSLLLQSVPVDSMSKFVLFLIPALVCCYLLVKFVRKNSIIARVL